MDKKLKSLQLMRPVIAGLLLIAVAIVERDAGQRAFRPTLLIAVVLVAGLTVIYFWVLPRLLSLSMQAGVQSLTDLLLITWLIHRTGDIESPFLLLYVVVIFAASVVYGRTGVLVVGGAALALYACLSTMMLSGVLPRSAGWPRYSETSLAWQQFLLAINMVALCAVTVLSAHLAERAKRSESELAMATRELADNRLFNDRIIESVRSGLVTTDLNGNIKTFNRAAEEITGHRSLDVRGKNIYEVFGNIEKQIEVGLESIRTRSRLPRFDIGCRTANGTEIHLGFSVAPLVDEADQSRGYVLTFQDLTEVMELEREVRRQERLAALGKMAAGLAHEIRNPLASMRGSVQVLASELTLSPDQLQLMDIVLRESDRLNRIVSDFLTYARPPKTEKTTVELAGLLSETVSLLRNSPELLPTHRVTEAYPNDALHYSGDPNQIRQIFWNLSRNAIQAMPNGGELRVQLAVESNQDVTITFCDAGEGMSREQKDRLFEPFSSSSGGTGLGMAIVYQLVRDHDGKILVESVPGNGTTIAIRLPASGRVAFNSSRSSDTTKRTGAPASVEALTTV